jgi:hypothetical protein
MFHGNRQLKMVRLSILRTGLYLQEIFLVTIFFRGGVHPRSIERLGLLSIKNSIDNIGCRTGVFLACSSVPEPNAPLRDPP